MKSLARTNGSSFAPASVLTNQVNRVFRDLFEDWGLAPFSTEGWAPALDMMETADEFVVHVELPGIDPKDVQITAVGNELSIRGETKAAEEKDEPTYHARERRWGSFVRTITLPRNVDAERVRAEFKNGLLAIHLPKRADAKPRQIKINAG